MIAKPAVILSVMAKTYKTGLYNTLVLQYTTSKNCCRKSTSLKKQYIHVDLELKTKQP